MLWWGARYKLANHSQCDVSTPISGHRREAGPDVEGQQGFSNNEAKCGGAGL